MAEKAGVSFSRLLSNLQRHQRHHPFNAAAAIAEASRGQPRHRNNQKPSIQQQRRPPNNQRHHPLTENDYETTPTADAATPDLRRLHSLPAADSSAAALPAEQLLNIIFEQLSVPLIRRPPDHQKLYASSSPSSDAFIRPEHGTVSMSV